MNSLLLTLTAVLILVLSALFAAPLFIDWNDYRSVFETQATSLFGRKVKVDGKVHLVLLPAPELRFDNVKVADEAGRLDLPFLEARSIEAWLNFSSLLSGTVEARKIAVLDPILRLDVKADGTGNWNDVGRKGVKLPFATNNVMLDSISVSGGRVEITREGKPALTLDAVTGEASAASLSGPYKVQATYVFEDRSQELRFSTSEPDAQGLFRLKAVLKDGERDTTYSFDGGVTGFGAKPEYDGRIVVRIAEAGADEPSAPAPETADPEAAPEPGASAETASFFELKGPLRATPERAEIPDFDLTIHAKGRPQILKGRLDLGLTEPFKTDVELSARFIDLDTLLGSPAAQRPPPAAVLYMFADEALGQAAKFSDGTLALTVEQANLGGDLIGGLNIAVAASKGSLAVERLKAVLPGDNRLDLSGRLSHGAIGPVFAGPIKIEGSGLRALTRWAAGDRDVSGQASLGAFVLSANASVGDGQLKLADIAGELSETKFSGAVSYQGGKRNLLELSLDSDRLDLREMIGEGPIWSSWLAEKKDSTAPQQNLLTQLHDDDVRVTLNVGELLLPNIPPGRLDARFNLLNGTLDVEKLDFAAASAIALNGKGRIESVSRSPSGRADFALKAETTDSLRIVSVLFGLPNEVSSSKHLSALAPLDIHVGLIAAREGEATKASLEIGGKAAGSDVALVMRATGEPGKLADANIEIGGSVTGERPQALLVLLFPELPQERMAAASQDQGTLSVKLKGVPKSSVAGNFALKTAAMQLGFNGRGSLQGDVVSLKGKTAILTKDASLAIMMAGLEAPPSATGVPLELSADVVKQARTIDLTAVTGRIAGQPVDGSAHFDMGDGGTKFTLAANAGDVSLPSLLGVLVAWQRTPSTEEMLGSINTSGAEVWPARGFSLGELEKAEGEIKLTAKTLALGDPFSVSGATLLARVDKAGLTVTDLTGRLFGGTLAASGTLQPRGAGAELEAHAGLTGGKLEELSKSLAGSSLAQGPFDLTFKVQGEGLSPPGLVAGLSGEGTIGLGAGALQSLNPEPLRRVAAKAAKKVKADKDEVAAEARTVRETLTKGRYKYAPARFAFDVKNGTLRLKPALLSGAGAETKINAYVELASMKLDSEWVMSLAGGSKDVPPVSLVFAGPLSKAAEITPAIDTAAIESYLTVSRMQDDVERLENLDVSGKGKPPADLDEAPPAEELPWQQPRPTAEREAPDKPQLQSGPPDGMLPPATEVQMPVPAIDPAPEAPPVESQAAEPAPIETASPAEPTIESLLGPPAEVAVPAPEQEENPAVPPVETAAPAPETAKPAEPTIETLLAPAPAEAVAPAAESSPAPPATETAMPVRAIEEQKPAAPSIQSPPPAAPPTETALPAPPPAESAPVAAPVNQAIPAAVAPAPLVTRPRPPRKPARARRDDWKKGISVFGGG